MVVQNRSPNKSALCTERDLMYGNDERSAHKHLRGLHSALTRQLMNLGNDRVDPISVDKLRFVPACVACPGAG